MEFAEVFPAKATTNGGYFSGGESAGEDERSQSPASPLTNGVNGTVRTDTYLYETKNYVLLLIKLKEILLYVIKR